jgi:molybdopterin-containing oxidoreductase family molybdopterin binding subunit
MWENWDYVNKTPWVLLQQPTFTAPGDPLSDIEIFSGVARKLGYGDYWKYTDKQYVQERFASSALASAGFNWEEFERTGIWTPSGTNFTPTYWTPTYSTQTRKFEFYNEAIATSTTLTAEEKRQKVPAYGKPYEDQNDTSADALVKKYPLKFTQYHDRQSVHTQTLLSPVLKIVATEPYIEMNTEDAAARDIVHNDIVRVFNDRGSMKLRVWVTAGVIKGAIGIPCGWAPKHFIEGHYQMLTHCKQNNVENLLGESNCAFYDNLVEVEKA